MQCRWIGTQRARLIIPSIVLVAGICLNTNSGFARGNCFAVVGNGYAATEGAAWKEALLNWNRKAVPRYGSQRSGTAPFVFDVKELTDRNKPHEITGAAKYIDLLAFR